MNKKIRVFAIFPIITLAVVGAISLSVIDKNNNVGVKSPKQVMKKESKEIVPIKYVSSEVSDFYDEVSSIDKARGQVDFQPRVPKVDKLNSLRLNAVSKPGKIMVKKSEIKAARGIRLEYGDIWMTIDPKPGTTDYDWAIKERPDVWSKTSINGNTGIETEQGNEDVIGPDKQVIGKHHHPTAIVWCENGMEYSVYSEALSLDKVRDFVETMY